MFYDLGVFYASKETQIWCVEWMHVINKGYK